MHDISQHHSHQGCKVLTSRPDQEEPPVPPLVKLGHYAINNVRLGREDVYGVHVSYGLSSLLEALDVWRG